MTPVSPSGGRPSVGGAWSLLTRPVQPESSFFTSSISFPILYGMLLCRERSLMAADFSATSARVHPETPDEH